MKLNSEKYAIALILTVCTAFTGCTTYSRGSNQVEVTDATENRSLSLLSEINQLEAENSELKNQVEVLQYELDQLSRRAQTQQAELDRLYRAEGLTGYTYEDPLGTSGGNSNSGWITTPQPEQESEFPVQTQSTQTQNTQTQDIQTQDIQTQEIEVGTTGQGTAVTPSVESVPQSTSSLSAQEIYNLGFEQLKQGQYDESIQTFSDLLANHPSSTFADDAQYWSGEAYYVNREFSNALQAFNNVSNNYPSSDRAPDAMLKIGYIYYEQGDAANARNVFNDILVKYPNERVADFARERLKNL